MKNLIFILSILFLGITSCNKSEELITTSDDTILEQLNQQLENEPELLNNLKQTTTTMDGLPEVGDQIYIKYKVAGAGNYVDKPFVLDVKGNSNAFSIIAGLGSYKYYFLGSKNQVNVSVSDCYAPNVEHEFLSYKTAAYFNTLNPNFIGHYDWNPNGGCATSGINDYPCTIPCPIVDPKIVLFHKTNKNVAYVNW